MNNGNKIRSFTDLNAWREGHNLVLMIYEITKKFPKDSYKQIINNYKANNYKKTIKKRATVRPL